MDAAWTRERISAPIGNREKFRETGGERSALQAKTRVAYPAKGGFGEIFRALGERVIQKKLGIDIVRIAPDNHIAYARDGVAYRYETLISTLPLPQLLTIIDNVPHEVLSKVS